VLVAKRNALAVLCATFLTGCTALPSLEDRSTSFALAGTGDTRLGAAIAPRAAANPGHSGIYPLLDSRDAFAARVLLARAAERSLDVQYYIWQDDLSGRLLFQALHEAAGRGVRVRLLLDDNGIAGLDATLAALDAHPDIEVRLFNPFASRSLRWVGYLTDFRRLNRRMHNKSFTADNQATIVGGRNIGDEYFDAAEGSLFVDLDVLAVGPVVREVSADFDRYWASGSAYPIARLVGPAPQALHLSTDVERQKIYIEAIRRSPFVRELLEGRLPLEWAPARLVSDDPAKALGQAAPGALLPRKLGELLGEPRAAVDLVSAYFVPAQAGTESFVAMARGGVKVRVLTNSLEATDVAVVHSGYAKRRKALLEAGVRLFELKAISPASQRGSALTGSAGSSAASLHAKTFAVDRSRVFVGSFNFDPRSAHLNTEMGLVIDSPALAQNITEAFERNIPERSYEVRLSAEGALYWIEHRGAETLRHDTEPGSGFWKRTAVRLLSLLPIEWLL
jgi:putative cardiolipin synthase